MLDHPTGERLAQLRWFGRVHALTEQAHPPDLQALTFEERLGWRVDREFAERQNRQRANRLRQARLKQAAVAEDLNYRHPRGLDRAVVRRLLASDGVRAQQNVLVTGPTGVRKTCLACTLANTACRQGHPALSQRLPRWLEALALARSMTNASAICSKSSTSAIRPARPWSPVSDPWPTGTRPSAIPPWPMPSSIA